MGASNSRWAMIHIGASSLPDEESALLPARMTRPRRTVRSRLASVFSWARAMQFPVADPPAPIILNPHIRREGR
jgi:hypothetical protein